MTALLSIFNLILAVVLLEVGSALTGVLIPIRSELAGFATPLIGALGTAYYIGFVAGCLSLPRLIERFGHIRCFSALAAMATCTVLLHAMVVVPFAWLSLRLMFGVAFAGLFMVVESWLNDQATAASRGRVFGTYMVATWLGVIVGKLLFPVASPDAFQLFSLAAIAIGLSIVPVALTTGAVPSIPRPEKLGFVELYRLAPVGLIGCLGVGAGNGAFWSLAPLFAQAQGASALDVSLFMSACVLGGMLSQWPLGWYSDRVDRRRVILGASLVAALAGFALALQSTWPATRTVQLLLAASWGASALSVYSLCVAHANDRAVPGTYIAVSGYLLLAFGFGAIVGPLAAGFIIAYGGISTLFVFTGVIHTALSLFVLHRIRMVRPVNEIDRAVFAPQVPAGHGTQAMLGMSPTIEPDMPDAKTAGPPAQDEAPAIRESEPNSTPPA